MGQATGRPDAPLPRTHLPAWPDRRTLVQKLQPLAFSLDDEPSTAEVTGRARKGLRRRPRHQALLRQVQEPSTKPSRSSCEEAIPVQKDREVYASVMLDRLMFVYFIQKKGFLDNDPDYLR